MRGRVNRVRAQADLLVINKTDLAEAVGANLEVMRSDAAKIRDGGPMCFCQVPPSFRTCVSPSRERCCVTVGRFVVRHFLFIHSCAEGRSHSHGRRLPK